MVRKIVFKQINEEIITLWDKIDDFIGYNKVSIFLKHCFRFLKRLPKWLTVAWKQEDWDFEYLYDLIELKLKEFKKAQEEDTWHVEYETKRRAKQIDICLQRLDRYRNWPKYYDYPTDDIVSLKTKEGLFRMEDTNEKNEKQRRGAHDFEKKNYDKFWKDFLDWHQGWWT